LFSLYLPIPYVLLLRLGFFKVNYKTNGSAYLLTYLLNTATYKTSCHSIHAVLHSLFRQFFYIRVPNVTSITPTGVQSP
jgi:hypothetical protein